MRRFKFDIESGIATLAAAGIVLFLILRFSPLGLEPYANYPLYIVLALGGIPLVIGLIKNVIRLEFGSDLLAGISIVSSVLLEEYLAGSLVVLMLSGGKAIENYAIRTASLVLETLAKRAPTVAHRKSDGSIFDIPVNEIGVGDHLVIFPHEICPVDGDVIEGSGVMDESYLTGEPFLMLKAPGSQVFSGAINGESSVTISAAKLAIDSRYEKIMEVMRETEQKRPRMRRLADTIGTWYNPLALAIAGTAWYLSNDPVRFLAVLVIATPCPLLIAIPVAIIGSISLCASRGILIKDPVVLEQLDKCRTMVFDKTGTLTYGKPDLNEQQIYGKIGQREVLQLVASLERYSKHPLSGAILERARQEGIPLLDAQRISEPPGAGLKGMIGGKEVVITSRKGLGEFPKADQTVEFPAGSGLECVILINGELAALYRFRDVPRKESKSFIRHLGPKHGFKRLLIVSGDRKEEVKYLADTVGIKEVYAGQSPEEKVRIVEKERNNALTAYLGDGINDAPALLAANVGIAFGANSDITAEAAGAVVMENTLESVDEFLHISRRLRKIALQSALGGVALSVAGMGFAAFGYLPPVAGAIGQELIDVLAIMNALRTIWKPKMLSDIPNGK